MENQADRIQNASNHGYEPSAQSQESQSRPQDLPPRVGFRDLGIVVSKAWGLTIERPPSGAQDLG